MQAWTIRLRHLWLALRLLPSLATQPNLRALLAEMGLLCRQLPAILKQPIPQAMGQLETWQRERPLTLPPESQTRQLADLAALLARRSPLGLCLRRSLLRYHYLKRLEVPVIVVFGAKFAPGETPDKKKITGHAWLTLEESPYFEDEENWRDYTVMLHWPNPENKS